MGSGATTSGANCCVAWRARAEGGEQEDVPSSRPRTGAEETTHIHIIHYTFSRPQESNVWANTRGAHECTHGDAPAPVPAEDVEEEDAPSESETSSAASAVLAAVTSSSSTTAAGKASNFVSNFISVYTAFT